ncbi:hypothetical protein [Catenovulum maritimum]|uniref:Uncharacterized protein n=1 Tax=Catenovulum maritimum TaxID=1513271 RepID=A0A0J8JLF7_9ALTE|nr:hypothetical protein [Catenovulum maritimum]KMT65396.1 hypothetical protein XM47_08500 [Catenovulum maritimum]
MLEQQDFANDSSRLLSYAQLCNVFYERELRLLTACDYKPDMLKKRLNSLPFYIKRAAESLLSLENPLSLDTQNGTWSAKQKRKSPTEKITIEMNQKWLTDYAQVGLIVPVVIIEHGHCHFRLDCIDLIKEGRIRLNEHGWFTFDGQQLSDTPKPHKAIYKATREVMTAAACGHQWIGTDTTFPRTLTLRELLLTTVINWTNLNKPMLLAH